MTIIAGFSSSRQGPAPLNLAAQVAAPPATRSSPLPSSNGRGRPKTIPIENEYLSYVTVAGDESIDRVVSASPGDLDITTVVHQSTSFPSGLMELAAIHKVDLVVVGSSSSGLLGRVGLGSVTERLVHTASVPVAIAPRGYASGSGPIRRLSAAYGGEADVNGLVAAAAELAKSWSVRLRIVSFTVRPVRMFAGSIEPSAENLVVQQWSRRTYDDIVKQLNSVRARSPVPDVEVVVGSGHDWREAVEAVSWEPGDLLVLGSGAAGPAAQVFLGSAASKILRHSPVPVMIVPRYQLAE